MILSKKNRFVFIKGQKVAGTSLEIMLASICGPEDIITPVTPIDERYRVIHYNRGAQNYGPDELANRNFLEALKNASNEDLKNITIPQQYYYNHMPLLDVIRLHGDIPQDWTIFAIERDPYRKVISLANMQLSFKHYQYSGNAMKSSISDLKQHLDRIINDGSIAMVRNIDRYKDASGNVRAEILKFENLQSEVDNLMGKLNINDYPAMEHFKKGLSSNNLDLHEILSREQILKINQMFQDEFEYFGYPMV
jgi:hypothetical protein